jgi:hypothetical protein
MRSDNSKIGSESREGILTRKVEERMYQKRLRKKTTTFRMLSINDIYKYCNGDGRGL